MRLRGRISLISVFVALGTISSGAHAEAHFVMSCGMYGWDEMQNNRVDQIRQFAVVFSDLAETESVPAFFEIDDRNGLLHGAELTGAYWDASFEGRPAFHAVFESTNSGDRFDVISDMKRREDTGQGQPYVLATIFSEESAPDSPPVYLGECSMYEDYTRADAEVALRVLREQSSITRVPREADQ